MKSQSFWKLVLGWTPQADTNAERRDRKFSKRFLKRENRRLAQLDIASQLDAIAMEVVWEDNDKQAAIDLAWDLEEEEFYADCEYLDMEY